MDTIAKLLTISMLLVISSSSLANNNANSGANRTEKEKQLEVGKIMYSQLCYSCHENGDQGAPILGFRPDWKSRVMLGREALIDSVIAGKGFMVPKGGGAVESRAKIGSMVDYMVSTVLDEQIHNSPSMKAQVKRSMQIRNGLRYYSETCFSCHNTGEYNAPRLGDKAAWKQRKQKNVSALVENVINGHGAMIIKGGSAVDSREKVKDMVLYMLSTVESEKELVSEDKGDN